MGDVETSELRLRGSGEDVLAAIREALPGDAIVRDEDDAIGRFAAERIVMIVARGGRRLKLIQGNWRVVKDREDKPHLDVELVDGTDGVTARLSRAPEEKPGPISHVMNFVGNAATVGILVVAYYLYKDIPTDWTMVAGVGAGGGIVWSAVGYLLPRKEDVGLESLVRGALKPLAAEDDGETRDGGEA